MAGQKTISSWPGPDPAIHVDARIKSGHDGPVNSDELTLFGMAMIAQSGSRLRPFAARSARYFRHMASWRVPNSYRVFHE